MSAEKLDGVFAGKTTWPYWALRMRSVDEG